MKIYTVIELLLLVKLISRITQLITPTALRRIMAEDKGNPPARKVERLILHQSNLSPSLSSPSHSEGGVELQTKVKGFGISLGLQRPETSRGRLVCTPNTQLDDAEPPLKYQDSSLEEEAPWRIWKENEKEEEEEKRTKREDWSLREKKEEMKREKRKIDREVEEEREQITREKEKKICLLQGKLRREEEEEEKKLKQESKERLR